MTFLTLQSYSENKQTKKNNYQHPLSLNHHVVSLKCFLFREIPHKHALSLFFIQSMLKVLNKARIKDLGMTQHTETRHQTPFNFQYKRTFVCVKALQNACSVQRAVP